MAYNDFVQSITNAIKDALTLDDVVNGEPNTQAKSRLGRLIYSLATINHRVDVATTQANQKLTELQAAINTAAAAGAGAKGWTDTLIETSENVNQRQINDGLESVSQLAGIKNPRNGMRVTVKSYHAPNYALAKPFDNGGGTFIYDASKASVNDGGMVINGWVRQFDRTGVLVDWFGAKGDGTTDDTQAFQKAVDFAGAQNTNIEVLLSSSIYVVDTVKAESATRRNLTIRGTHNGYAGGTAYDFRNTNAGSTILHKGTGASVIFDINDGRYNNNNVHIKNVAIVGNYYDANTQTTGTTAIRIAKADINYPDETWYKVNYLFQNVSFVNCFMPVVFTSPLTAPTYTSAKNFIGDILLDRCSAYSCGWYLMAENVSMNRLTIRDNFLFGLTKQAFASKPLDGINENDPRYLPILIRMKIENTHFEGVRGLFNLMMTIDNFEDSRSSIEISNVTREWSSLYESGIGSAIGFVKNTDFIISGRFEDKGWNEQTGLELGQNCTIQSVIKLNPKLPDVRANKSPYTINTDISAGTQTIAANTQKTLTFIASDVFDAVDAEFVIDIVKADNTRLGMKTYKVSGDTSSQASKTLAESGGISASGITMTAALHPFPEYILQLTVNNTTTEPIMLKSSLNKNTFGQRMYVYVS